MQDCLALGGKCHRPPDQLKERPPDLRFRASCPTACLCSDNCFASLGCILINTALETLLARKFCVQTNYTIAFASIMADTWKWTADSKLCFVTTGATAPFTALIESVLSPPSLDALRQRGFTHLLVQYGSAKDIYTKCASDACAHLQQAQSQRELIIDGIDFNPEGLQAQFQLVQRSKGLVISHAGTGCVECVVNMLC